MLTSFSLYNRCACVKNSMMTTSYWLVNDKQVILSLWCKVGKSTDDIMLSWPCFLNLLLYCLSLWFFRENLCGDWYIIYAYAYCWWLITRRLLFLVKESHAKCITAAVWHWFRRQCFLYIFYSAAEIYLGCASIFLVITLVNWSYTTLINSSTDPVHI